MRVVEPQHRLPLKGCGASIPGGAQSSAGPGSEQPDLPGPTLSGALGWITSGEPFQPAQPLCLLAISRSSHQPFEGNVCVCHTTGAERNCMEHHGVVFGINTVSWLF